MEIAIRNLNGVRFFNFVDHACSGLNSAHTDGKALHLYYVAVERRNLLRNLHRKKMDIRVNKNVKRKQSIGALVTITIIFNIH